jgi:hypothetical protein
MDTTILEAGVVIPPIFIKKKSSYGKFSCLALFFAWPIHKTKLFKTAAAKLTNDMDGNALIIGKP